jgi:hypothetical protein
MDKELISEMVKLIYAKDPEAISIIDRYCDSLEVHLEIPSDLLHLEWQMVYFPDEGGMQIDVIPHGICTFELHPAAFLEFKKLIRKRKIETIL